MIANEELRSFVFRTHIKTGEQHCEKSERSEFRMNEAGVLSGPPEACGGRELALYDRAGIDIRA